MRPLLLPLALAACAAPDCPAPDPCRPAVVTTACPPVPKPDACVAAWYRSVPTPACADALIERLGGLPKPGRKP